MRRHAVGLASVSVLVLVLAVPSIAGATTFKGKSSQGATVRLSTAADGTAQAFLFPWRGRCGRPGKRFMTVTRSRPPWSVTPNGFVSTGSYSYRQADGLRLTVSGTAGGHRVSTYRWAGSFRMSAVVRRGGRVFDRCHSQTVRWAASIPQASVEMTGDPGEYVTTGGSYAFSTPAGAVFVAQLNARTLSAAAGGFELVFRVPAGHRLRPGRYANATRYPFDDHGATLDVLGHGRGCNMVKGEFTILSSSFDRHANLTAIVLTFEHHCEGGPRAIRGKLRYRAG